ncbi:MAG TPA: ATP-binding cassette domain-containing protein [Nocardioidaceae bacterium]|nr:ATP-binding cassette domain-containing protein [Nocardioidaceae bacterium]
MGRPRRRHRAVARPGGADASHRSRLRAAHHVVVGPAAARLLRPAAPHLSGRRGRHRSNLAEFSELLDLGDLLDVAVRQLSLGQRMRGDVAAALLHDPEILYLDEPTIGLDVVSKGRLREFLRAVNSERDVTLLLTTHDLQDIEQLCRRVMVIDHGALVYDGALAGLHARGSSTRTLVVDLVDEEDPIQVAGATVQRVDGPRQWLSFPADASAAPIVAAVAASYDVADLSINEPDIEDVIREIYLGG